MKHQEYRDILMARTMEVMATLGLDKTTTKAIASGTGINEGYIYRFFATKEEMMAAVFDQLDEELIEKTMESADCIRNSAMPAENRWWLMFVSVWRFLLGNPKKCRAYIRFYYSPYFQQYSAQSHDQRFEPLTEKLQDVFREEANVRMILHHVFNVMMDFAIKVFDNAVPDNEDTAEHVFRLVYISIQQYFR